jgi:hypothetical protein
VAQGLAGLLFVLAVRGAAAEEVAAGTRIVSVRIDRHDVFALDDPSTSAWPYRWVNALHVLTREEFIRRLLLFRAGDSLDPVKLAESELILRETGFLNPVNITWRPVPGGAEVTVETHDQWTTSIRGGYGVTGDRTSVSAGFSEDNFLGLGKSFLFDVSSDPERTSTTFRYRDPTFLRSRWRLELGHQASSDGSADHFRLEYPFFSLSTPRAGGFEGRREKSREYLWSGGERRVTGQAETLAWEVWGGLRFRGAGIRTDRLVVGAFGERAHFRDWESLHGPSYPQPEDRDLVGLQLGWSTGRSAGGSCAVSGPGFGRRTCRSARTGRSRRGSRRRSSAGTAYGFATGGRSSRASSRGGSTPGSAPTCRAGWRAAGWAMRSRTSRPGAPSPGPRA